MYENNSAGFVDLHKTVYALKCPVCGAECKSRESGECPYCGAYLEFSGGPQQQAPVNTGIPMQAYNVPPAYPQQPAYTIPQQEAEKRLHRWKQMRMIAGAIYVIIAGVSILGVTMLNEGDKGYNIFMSICILGYFPLSFLLPIIFAVSRPDYCIKALGLPQPMNKVVEWLMYGSLEFGLMIALSVGSALLTE